MIEKEKINIGEYYVYCFINDDWKVPFYVSKGRNGRIKQMKNRNHHVLNICKNFKWHSEIIEYCPTENDAIELENNIKNEYKNRGYPIIDYERIYNYQRQREGIEKAKKRA